MNTKRTLWKVGDVAKATGVTIRTLHHYEEIRLLQPSARSESGHRVYTESDLQKLQQILSLKQIGLSLDEIRDCLSRQNLSPLEVVRLHKKRVWEEREKLEKLYDTLAALERTLSSNREPSVHELLTTIEVIRMHEKYFSKEQLAELKTRKETLGDKKMEEYQQSWNDLTCKVRDAAQKNTDPASPSVQALATEWDQLVKAFTGGNAGIEVQLGSMYRNEPSMREQFGLDPQLYDYVAKMMSYFHKAKK